MLTIDHLEKRFGTFEGIAQSPTVPKKEYVRQPMSGNSPLWEAYRREDAERQKKREQMRQDRLEQRDDAVKDFRLRNLLIKNMTSGILNKLILYRLSRAKLKKKLQKEQWIDWNKTKARQQSSDSLSYLQTRNRLEHQAFLAGVEKLPFGRPEKVTGKGTRMYPGGPGFGGQKYMEECTEKIREVRELIEAEDLDVDVQVDGGINDETMETVLTAGANLLVAGSYVFNDDLAKNVKHARERMDEIIRRID